MNKNFKYEIWSENIFLTFPFDSKWRHQFSRVSKKCKQDSFVIPQPSLAIKNLFLIVFNTYKNLTWILNKNNPQ